MVDLVKKVEEIPPFIISVKLKKGLIKLIIFHYISLFDVF
jgi:hypothetical protein